MAEETEDSAKIASMEDGWPVKMLRIVWRVDHDGLNLHGEYTTNVDKPELGCQSLVNRLRFSEVPFKHDDGRLEELDEDRNQELLDAAGEYAENLLVSEP